MGVDLSESSVAWRGLPSALSQSSAAAALPFRAAGLGQGGLTALSLQLSVIER